MFYRQDDPAYLWHTENTVWATEAVQRIKLPLHPSAADSQQKTAKEVGNMRTDPDLIHGA